MPRTAADLAGFIGKRARYRATLGLTFDVRIIDAKWHYGGVAYLIQPTAGEGEKWVAANLEIIE